MRERRAKRRSRTRISGRFDEFGRFRLWPYATDVTKRYLVRTFGCQMNEHDSERLAGLLEADGYAPTTDVEDADVVVLNTCCIRENADQRLYGTLGRLKELVDAIPKPQGAAAAVELTGVQTPDKALKQDDVDDLLASLGF